MNANVNGLIMITKMLLSTPACSEKKNRNVMSNPAKPTKTDIAISIHTNVFKRRNSKMPTTAKATNRSTNVNIGQSNCGGLTSDVRSKG